MLVKPIPVGARIFDTIAPLTASALRGMHDAGADGVMGYLGVNLTPDAVANAHALGMGILPVNESRREGWQPSATLGEADAVASTRRMAALGIPTGGLHDWCDLEGCGGDPTDYCNAWSHVVDDGGRLSGLYVGAGDILSGHQLYALPGFTGYMRSCSRVPEPDCGWMLMQLYQPNLMRGGVQVDISVACADWKGRQATWVVGA